MQTSKSPVTTVVTYHISSYEHILSCLSKVETWEATSDDFFCQHTESAIRYTGFISYISGCEPSLKQLSHLANPILHPEHLPHGLPFHS